MVYLITGACGTGKTWLLKQLIKEFSATFPGKCGLYNWVNNFSEDLFILGVYDGSTFEGSDRLSMAVMTSNNLVKDYFAKYTVICEGDRFTNKTFINDFNPVIIRIKGDGSEGRAARGSSQTERQIKSIATRVANILPHITVNNSAEALLWIKNELKNPTVKPTPPAGAQTGLF